jgi:hypothetical protein
MLQTIKQDYISTCNDLDKQEADIKTHIVSNFQHHRELLKETTKQQPKMFARLMARVGGGGGSGGGSGMSGPNGRILTG